MFSKAFTMIELVFAIVVIGILSAIAIPRFAATRDDAIITKGRSQVASIRSGIAMQKSRNMLKGKTPYYPSLLDNATANASQKKLFFFNDGNNSNILEYPLYSKKAGGHWWKENNTTYNFFLNQDKNVTFTYSPTTGTFDCDHTIEDCKQLTQ